MAPNEGSAYPSVITDKYFVSKRLGSGACGTVSLVYDRTTCLEYAIKHVKKNPLAGTSRSRVNDPKRIMNEAEIMKAIDHVCTFQIFQFTFHLHFRFVFKNFVSVKLYEQINFFYSISAMCS